VKHLSKTSALYLQASMLACFLAGASAPTRLDALLTVENGFPPEIFSVFYGICAFAALLSLLVVGSLSDYIGRRPVLIVAALLHATSMWLFTRVQGVPTEELFVGRVLQGVAIGGAVSALGAGMLDVAPAKGIMANVIAWMLGVATAGVTGSFLQYLPNPTRLTYAVFGAIYLALAIGVALMPESLTVRAGTRAWLRPSFRLPREVLKPLLLAMPTWLASSGMLGFYCWHGPDLLRYFELIRLQPASGWIFYAPGTSPPSGLLALGGLTLFAFGGGAVGAVRLTFKCTPCDGTRVGMVLLLLGSALTMLAMRISSSPLLFVACVIAGAGSGAAWQAALCSVLLIASPPQRAAVSSVLYLVVCVATALPALLNSWLYGGERYSLYEYLSCVMVLAALALVCLVCSKNIAGRIEER